MGIPKFFRYISERYPLTSQVVEENKIPEFDNLYVDFNGIIHNCSHPDDSNAHFRLSEEDMFTSIFNYVDHLFGTIKPKKLFFMAIDGVAPRAKMNQQRGRRFRTAKEAKEIRDKAIRKGEELPKEKPFDSNCITPGTVFMAKLSEQLRYFVNKKITEDTNWRDVEVVLSGHDVPGEGEHKIMEYIRLSKAQPDYNPNVRHCLYGLDADLIMLGLLSHDPHFCLLREEVKFGPQKKKGNASLEAQKFFLLHLCLLREYLDLEFAPMISSLPFEYNLERVIDDFILLAVFVGNDFLPHLPDIHIHQNGLEMLFEIYKSVLPRAGGYVNESGTINLKRLQMILDELSQFEIDNFQKSRSETNWFKGKQRKFADEVEIAKKRGNLVISEGQLAIFNRVKDFVISQMDSTKRARGARLTMVNNFPARERSFIATLAADLNLSIGWDEFDEEDRNLVSLSVPSTSDDEEDVAGSDELADDEWVDVDDSESRLAIDRVLKKYARATVMQDDDEAGGSFDEREARRLKIRMDEWKREYYREKLEFSYDDPKPLGDLVYRYVEGLQWVMYYYYSGVASWGWFYDYHYSPKITDLKGLENLQFDFELGKPFRPYEQLMGVLPEASKELIPLAYRDLMYIPTSPILDFYPQEFELDMNGKKQEWEAIVKIPFIDQHRLLAAMGEREHRLTEDERFRNSMGTSTRFVFDPEIDMEYPSSLPGFLPPIRHCQCKMEPFYLPTLDGLHLVEGLCDGVQIGVDALAGFPSLQTLPHEAMLAHHGVSVFQSESRNQSMVLYIKNQYEGKKTEEIANELIGKKIFVGWPFLQEGQVAAVSDSMFKFEKLLFGNGREERILSNPHTQHPSRWKRTAVDIEDIHSKKYAIVTGPVEALLHVRPLIGLKRLDDGALVKEYADVEKESMHAVQLSLTNVVSEDPRYIEKDPLPLHEEFPEGTKIIFLGEHAYGVAAVVDSTTDTSLSVKLAFFPSEKSENEKFSKIIASRQNEHYYPAYVAAEKLGLKGYALAKITSSLMVLSSDGSKTNIGLSLKFEAKGMKVLDYSRKLGRAWEFSEKALELMREYKVKFPEIFRSLDSRSDDMPMASQIFPEGDGDARLKEVKSWLASKGVRNFEPVPLFTDKLTKDTVKEIEQLADGFTAKKTLNTIKRALVKGIPRQAVLKPEHSLYRLQNQAFAIGDRVTMAQEAGGVPLCLRGVVIGLNSNSIDVVWDVPFMSGTTLGDRCSQYRGSTTPFNTCLNLTNRQFVLTTADQQNAQANGRIPRQPLPPFNPQLGPMPAVQGSQTRFRAAPRAPTQIMTNPHRNVQHPHRPVAAAQAPADHANNMRQALNMPTDRQNHHLPGQAPNARGWGGRGRGRGTPDAHPVSRGDRPPQVVPGRGRGGFRGRGAPSGGPSRGFPQHNRGGRGGHDAPVSVPS